MVDLISRLDLMASLANARTLLMEGEDMVGRMYGTQIFAEVERIVMEAPSQTVRPATYHEDSPAVTPGLLEDYCP